MTKQELIEENMKLVYFVLHRYYPSVANDEDMIQVGMLGLCKAADTWDGTSSKFSTYAVTCIMCEIRHEFRIRSRNIPSISLETQLSHDNPESELSDLIPADEIEFDNDLELERFTKTLSEGELEILKYMFNGMRQVDIQNKLGLSKGAVNERVRRIRRKWRMYNGNN